MMVVLTVVLVVMMVEMITAMKVEMIQMMLVVVIVCGYKTPAGKQGRLPSVTALIEAVFALEYPCWWCRLGWK